MPSLPDPRDPAVTLADVERAIRRLHPVAHLAPEEVEVMFASGGIALFDVRGDAEFAVGHLSGSVRLEPMTPADRFARDHGAGCAGRRVVFVCSVGLRSARMAERVEDALAPHRPRLVANLSGGLFRWAAEGRRPALPGIHPFDAAWGALLARSLAARG